MCLRFGSVFLYVDVAMEDGSYFINLAGFFLHPLVESNNNHRAAKAPFLWLMERGKVPSEA